MIVYPVRTRLERNLTNRRWVYYEVDNLKRGYEVDTCVLKNVTFFLSEDAREGWAEGDLVSTYPAFALCNEKWRTVTFHKGAGFFAGGSQIETAELLSVGRGSSAVVV